MLVDVDAIIDVEKKWLDILIWMNATVVGVVPPPAVVVLTVAVLLGGALPRPVLSVAGLLGVVLPGLGGTLSGTVVVRAV